MEEAEKTQPFVCIRMLDSDIKVIPISLINQVIAGEKPVSSLDEDWEEVVRAILYDWLHPLLLEAQNE